MLLELPKDFTQKLHDTFSTAASNGDVIFAGDTAERTIETQKVGLSSVDVETTLLKLLAKRPQKGSVDKNPFANPEPELTIVDPYGPNDQFRLVLNKFPTLAEHFMMITREFKSQDTPLDLDELVGTYSVLSKLYEDDEDREWFAFYNCGPESGASQPHKHVQFMTLPKSRKFTAWPAKLSKKLEAFRPNDRKEPLNDPELPFAHFVAKLPEKSVIELDPEELSFYFISLLQRVLTVLKEHEKNVPSYNFVLTTEYMMLVPRLNGKVGTIGLNTCGYMGLVLCKNQEDVNYSSEKGLCWLLEQGGFPNEAQEHSVDFAY